MKNLISTLEYLPSAFAGVVMRVESLPLAAKRLGDFVRGRNSAFEPREVERQAPCRLAKPWRDMEGLSAPLHFGDCRCLARRPQFETLLSESFGR